MSDVRNALLGFTMLLHLLADVYEKQVTTADFDIFRSEKMVKGIKVIVKRLQRLLLKNLFIAVLCLQYMLRYNLYACKYFIFFENVSSLSSLEKSCLTSFLHLFEKGRDRF